MKKLLSFFLLSFLVLSCQTKRQNLSEENVSYLVQIGDIAGVKLLNGKQLAITNNEGLTLLHMALMYNQPEITEYLVLSGAAIEAVDNYSRTPLLVGMYNDSFESVQVLKNRGANIFASDHNGNTPFSYSVKKKTYKHLLTMDNVLQVDSNGLMAIDYANNLKDQTLIDYILSLMKNSQKKISENPYATKFDVEKTVQYLLDSKKPYGGEFSEFEISVLKHNFGMKFPDGNTPLHYAAKKGHIGIVDFLISKNVDINAKNISNSTPLHEAVRYGHVEVAKLLLQAKADPNSCDSNGNTSLHLVMPEASRSKLFDELLKYGANVNAKDKYGETPMHIIARIGMSDAVTHKLISSGADVNERNKNGQTPLMLAIERNNLTQAKTFIELGANIHDQDNSGSSSLTLALDQGLDAVKLIVNKKNITSRDIYGRNALHLASKKNADISIVNYLLNEGCTINVCDKDGNTPLHIAVKNNYKDIGNALLSAGADIFVVNNSGDCPLKLSYFLNEGREQWIITDQTIQKKDAVGNTPLHLAAQWNEPNMITYLLDRGADINAKNDYGETPFFSAMKGNSPACIDALLNYSGMNINIGSRDFLGNSVLHTAVQWSAYDATMKVISLTDGKSLIGARNLAGKTALHIAANQGNLKFIQMLLSYGIDVNETDEIGQSPLVYAINGNKLEAVKYLVEQNASVIQQDMYGKTPLHFAVQNKNIECVKILQRAGGKIMTKDSDGITPLTEAFKQSINMIDAVIGQGKNIQDSDGQSPLHIAVIENISKDKLEFLLSKNFYINKRNKDGNTCLLLAIQLKRSELILPLLKEDADPFITNNKGESPLSEVLMNSNEYLHIFSKNIRDMSDAMEETILHYAARLSTPETVKELLKLGHDPNKKNIEGKLPIDIAKRWERQDVVSVFENFSNGKLGESSSMVE